MADAVEAGTTAEAPMNQIDETEEWGEEDENYEDEDYEEDEDEAEEIARRLKEQLWADISKAQADRASAAAASQSTSAGLVMSASTPSFATAVPAAVPVPSKKEEAALRTMKTILGLVDGDALARSTLASAVIPGIGNENVLDVLHRSVALGAIPKDLAKSLSTILVSLARSDALFSTLRHSNAPALQLDKGKRKRDESEEERRQMESRVFKKPNNYNHDLQQQITEAVHVVSNALSASSSSGRPLDPSVIASIQLQLHQIFLFSVTSSAAGGHAMNALQEISGLIQVVGVLSGIQIGPTTEPRNPNLPTATQQPGPSAYPHRSWIPSGDNGPHVPFSDIGTAVYPCLVPTCRKTFARLYSLRAHQRVHAAHRPYRCHVCPASFARNHDLKRHAKLHDKKAWQCAGCDKMFSRRDAIKRHKNSSAARGGKGEVCVTAAIKEVELDKQADEEVIREGRRAKMWSDIVTNHGTGIPGYPGYVEDGGFEEGEVHSEIIGRVQAAVLGLHSTLQAHVSNALGTPSDQATPPLHLDPTGGQATLASVIARAQLNMPSQAVRQQDADSGDVASGVLDPSLLPVHEEMSADPGTQLDHEENYTQKHQSIAGPSLSLYGLSDEQAKLLEQAIANAASAAQAQAEAEAAMEEEEEGYDDDEEGYEELDNNQQLDETAIMDITA
ncbi:hypothetical protein BJ138DRAFT_1163725 [Hygrophoropsis aurantiaca]|uniref:Uncharacterized protein n=1 Tax=Hygrophoropsis aurantiaca TaxID=72124 RepID=A0ACB7ZXU0_9AGAM|nr:hypothetical protein BJ138DRAFT_1163725 [Hygrophoropsis aurantiaca]